MKVFKDFNSLFVKYPFLAYVIIIFTCLIPFLIATVNEGQKEYEATLQKAKDSLVCKDTTIKPEQVEYILTMCNDGTYNLTQANEVSK